MRLSDLKRKGAVPGSLRTVSRAGVTCVSFAAVKAAGGEIAPGSVVILDNADWIATSKKRPPVEASTVYSGTNEGNLVGCQKRSSQTFCVFELVDDQLQQVDEIKLKEETEMADGNGNGSKTMNAFDVDLDGINFDEGAFKEPNVDPAPPEGGKKAKPKSEEELWVANIKSQLPKDGVYSRDAAVRNNRKYGRLVCFITGADNVLKLSVRSKDVLDANGQQVPDDSKLAGATPEQKAAWEKKGKYPSKYCAQEKYLAFNDTPPPQAKGMIVKVPAASDVDIDLLNTSGTFTLDDSKKDFVYKFLTKDMASLYIPGNFGSSIKEDESIVGPRASTIGFAAKRKTRSDSSTGSTSQQVVPTFYLDKDSGANRKKLICSTNYFPSKIYETVAFSDITDGEIMDSVNLNVAQALKKDGAYQDLSAESKNQVTLHEDGTYTCAWFNDHAQIAVRKYDAESDDDLVSDVRIPLRIRVQQKKDPTKSTIKYKYVQAGEPGGPQENPVFKRIIEATGLDEETFVEKVKKITARVTKPKAAKELITGDVYLNAVSSGLIDVGNITNFAAIGEELERLNA